ncbi:uncharacterized protein LOC117793944 [Drosophila innubila]|uniref:uncharacterized protein LOC117793944 n=1 Tax=Drosophila innubila TaxID=198719 RepID=UPI00148DB2B6|nr:uncharacterized protein LOC117793944 [Drosophila innubila]
MSDDPDYLYALKLQQQLDAEMSNGNANNAPQSEEHSDYELALMLQNEMINDSTDGNGNGDVDDSIENVSIRALDMTHNNNTNKNKNNSDNITLVKELERRNGINKQTSSFDTYLDQTQNLVHPEWELVDPTPDIYAMFVRFDEKFFQHRLGAVSVEWSKRMYSCAGICYQRGNRFVKEIIIRLSEPLLKLRPRKDLVETLLHEMIHAYCFVLNIREGNGGHGPNFKRIMGTINKVAGTNITVYHSFHDEVNAYKTHIWRCNGICQHHNPFQGWVKRTSNRAPGPSDQWWAKHQSECGGIFEKKSEPQKPSAVKPDTQAKVKSKQQSASGGGGGDIRNYFEKPKLPRKTVPNIMSTGNVVSALPPTSYPGTSSKPFEGLQTRDNKRRKHNEPNKIFGFKDLTGDNSSDGDEDQRKPRDDQQANGMQGPGYSLTNGKDRSSFHNMSDANKRNHLRDMWANRYSKDNEKTEAKKQPEESRKRRLSSANDIVSWENYDDDVMVRDVVVPIINISDSEDDTETTDTRKTERPKANHPSSQELTTMIKREIMEDESIYEDDDIMMIDDEYDADVDNLTAASELADQSIIDDLFGEDTLLKEFQRENDVVPCGSRNLPDAGNDITTCPICFDKMKRSEFANHLEGCNIIIRVPPPSMKGRTNLPPTSNAINKGKPIKRKRNKSNQKQILKSSGYTDSEIAALNLSSSSDSTPSTSDETTPRQMRQRSLHKNTVQCPKCGQELLGHQLEAHRKICKRGKR